MSNSFDLPDAAAFTVGTEGPPGERIFYLQARSTTEVVTLRLEKQQVALLADYLDRIVATYELEAGPAIDLPALVQPVIPEWIVGSIMVAIDEAESRIIVIAEELTPEDEDEDPDQAPSGAQARVSLTRPQIEAFVAGARSLVESGRPACPLCGRPINADGHFCPRLN
jgi:uncharacterized repeat protein (TIGR03847 family)